MLDILNSSDYIEDPDGDLTPSFLPPESLHLPRIRFNEEVEVVLAPSRADIQESGCDFWWKRQDYLLFQQSSFKEVRLYAVFHSLPFREARRKLYQSGMDDPDYISCMASASMKSNTPSVDSADSDTEETEYSSYPFVDGLASGLDTEGDGCEEEYDPTADPMQLYVNASEPIPLHSGEHNRHAYYNKHHSLSSRLFWVSAAGMLTLGGFASILTPLIGYYVLTFLQVTYLGDFI